MRIFLISFLAFVFLPIFSLANEGAAAEAPPSGGEHGGGAKAETPGGGLPPWHETESRMLELASKISAKEQSLSKLIEEKNKMPESSPTLKSVVESIIKEHKELTSLVADYEKKRNILKYRFPERGLKGGERTYDHIEVKSVEEMEKQLGVDGRLTRNMKKMRQQFGSVERKEKIQSLPKKDQSPKVDSNHGAPGSIEETGSVVLKK